MFPVSVEKPIIFDAGYLGEEVPEGFNAVLIHLDGKPSADLDWSREAEAADAYRKQGLALFWEMDLGLFGQLKKEIEDKTQYLTLALALDHLCEKLWRDFEEESVGISLYRGDCAFENQLQEEERLHCRDIVAEYLEMLAGRLPDTLPPYALVDARSIASPWDQLKLLSKERFRNIRLCVQSDAPLVWDYVREGGSAFSGFIGRDCPEKLIQRPRTALCIPSVDDIQAQHLQEVFQLMPQTPFRIIPEPLLITEWDELDTLCVLPKALTPQGIRMLQGFRAAGGTVVSLDETPLDLPGGFAKKKEIFHVSE